MSYIKRKILLSNSAMLGAVLLISTKPLSAESQPNLNASENAPDTIISYSQSTRSQDLSNYSRSFPAAQFDKQSLAASRFLKHTDLNVSNEAPLKADSNIAQVPFKQIDDEDLELIDSYSLEADSNDALDQVTNVNQLRDVSPGDWAFEALRALIERYGCIAGYPDQTYRGNSALTRYEFAAGLNSCLNQIERLIAASETIRQEDFKTIQRLSQEFEAELATLAGRTDNLESRVGFLEDNLFSTTTKLQGEVVFLVADEFISDDFDNNTSFGNRVRLDLNTSFTGRDLLFARITATNIQPFQLAEPSSTASIETQFGVPGQSGLVEAVPGGANEGEVSTQGVARFSSLVDTTSNDNDIEISKIYYQSRFDGVEVYAFANRGEHHDYAPVLNPFFQDLDSGLGSITTLSSENPIYRIGGGAGAALNLEDLLGPTTLTVGYLAGPDAADPSDSNGFFNGDYSVLAQIKGDIGNRLSLAFTYVHGYHPAGSAIFDAGLDTSMTETNALGEEVLVPGGGVVGTAVANNPSAELLGQQALSQRQETLGQPLSICNPDPISCPDAIEQGVALSSTGQPLIEPIGLVPIVTNSYGLEASVRVADKVSVSAFGSYTDAILIGEGDSEIWTYGLSIAFIDFLKESNVLGIFAGVQPYAGFVSGSVDNLTVDEVPVQLEAFYKYQVTRNISVTPGIIWISAPNQGVVQNLDGSSADDALVGVLRTTFSF